MDYVISPDGTRIAFDRLGSGPAVLLIGAGPTDRRSEAPLADLLAEHFVGVEDLQAKMDAAQALGATTVMPPMDVPGGPSIAMFADPDGNLIGLMKRP